MPAVKVKPKDLIVESPKQEVRELFEAYAKTHDPEIKEKIIFNYIKLARYLAGKFVYRGEPLDDLFQVACMALIKAIDRYDLSKNIEFTTFVTPTIVGEIKRHFRDKGWAFKVPRRLQEISANIHKTTTHLAAKLNRPPTTGEIAKEFKLTEEEITEAQALNRSSIPLSLDAQTQDADDKRTLNLFDSIGKHDGRLDHLEELMSLTRSFENLIPEEKAVLYLRYYQDHSQNDIAKLLDIPLGNVSKLQGEAIQKLRKSLEVREPF